MAPMKGNTLNMLPSDLQEASRWETDKNPHIILKRRKQGKSYKAKSRILN